MASPGTSISRPMIGLPTKARPEQRIAQLLYARAQSWQSNARLVSAAGSAVTVVCISDTHNTKPAHVPDGDVLVHAGDLSQYGTFAEMAAQLAWLRQLPHRHKVVIAGNHDLLLDRAFVDAHPDRELDGRGAIGTSAADLDWGDILYLEHSSAEVTVRDRSLRLFGSPRTPRSGSWAFQYAASENVWDGAVAKGTDILLTHGPPISHLDDSGKGCRMLLHELWRSRPALVVCGHIHGGRGVERLVYNAVQQSYEDAVRDGQHRCKAWLGVGRLVVCIILLRIQLWLRGPATETASTQLVNAASVSGRGNTQIHDPIVVTI